MNALNSVINSKRIHDIVIDEEFIFLCDFQNELRDLLSWYLNGMNFSCVSKFAYPFIDFYSIKMRNKIQDIVKLLNKLTRIYDLSNYKSAILDIQQLSVKETMPSKRLAGAIVKLEEIFAQMLTQHGVQGDVHKIEGIKDYAQWKAVTEDDQYLYPIYCLREYLSKHIKADLKGLYLHGSLSTLDYKKGFSDFDLIAIIKKEALFCEASLINIRNHFINAYNFLYLIDIFQHHGIGIITEFDMSFYPQSYFPLKLFNYTTELIKADSVLEFSIRDSSLDNKLIFDRYYQYIRSLAINSIRIKKAYDFKSFISTLLLLPCIYYQLKEDDYCYKKYSFCMVEPDFSHDVWSIVKKAESVRNEWCYTDSLPKYFQQLIGEWTYFKMLPRIKRKISRVSDAQLTTMGSNMISKSFKLADDMKKNLTKCGTI